MLVMARAAPIRHDTPERRMATALSRMLQISHIMQIILRGRNVLDAISSHDMFSEIPNLLPLFKLTMIFHSDKYSGFRNDQDITRGFRLMGSLV